MARNNTTSDGKYKPPETVGKRPRTDPTTEQVISYRKEILGRIESDPFAHRFFMKLTQRYRFNADEIVGGLLDNIFHERLGRRERLLASPTLPDSVREGLRYPSPGEWKENNPDPDLSIPEKARTLAEALEKAEVGTPGFGVDQLEQLKSSSESERAEAVRDLNQLPATLRLYADYFDKSRGWWGIIGRIEIDARTGFQKATRDLLQEQIRTRTGHYSDECYYRLLNIALEVVGLSQIERNALIMRRKRRRAAAQPRRKNR